MRGHTQAPCSLSEPCPWTLGPHALQEGASSTVPEHHTEPGQATAGCRLFTLHKWPAVFGLRSFHRGTGLIPRSPTPASWSPTTLEAWEASGLFADV